MSGSRGLSKHQPPAELSAAIAIAMANADDRRAESKGARAIIVAVERLLPRVVFADCEKRSGALGLLTLDALLTQAMEASADNSAECEATAAALLAAIGTTLGTE